MSCFFKEGSNCFGNIFEESKCNYLFHIFFIKNFNCLEMIFSGKQIVTIIIVSNLCQTLISFQILIQLKIIINLLRKP